MTQTISIKVNPYPKFQNETFLHIEAFQPLEVGKMYRFLEYPDLQFIRQALCVSVKFCPLGDVPDFIAYLDKSCDKQILFKFFLKKNFYQNFWTKRNLIKRLRFMLALLLIQETQKSIIMATFSTNLFWFMASQAFGMDVETTKIQLTQIGVKFDEDEEFSLSRYSGKVRQVVLFYLENKKHLQC